MTALIRALTTPIKTFPAMKLRIISDILADGAVRNQSVLFRKEAHCA